MAVLNTAEITSFFIFSVPALFQTQARPSIESRLALPSGSANVIIVEKLRLGLRRHDEAHPACNLI